MARLRLLLLPVLIACFAAVPAVVDAQTDDQTPPAHVSYTDGRVTLEYDANTEEVEPNTPLMPGDRLRTEAGRAEIVFGDGSVLHLDEYTTIDLLSDRLVRLLAGRLAVMVNTGLARHLQIDAAPGSVRVLSSGEYRIALLSHGTAADLELAVVRGSAELFNDTDLTTLRAGQRAVADAAGAFAGPWPFNSASFDPFGHWSLARLDARRGHTSYPYVPAEVRHYAGDFDRHGSWAHEPSYGYVWYPHVSYGWRPYYHGRWKHYPRWGWVWVGGPRWAWPTHHYGRWGIASSGAWFWIPGRQWSGAWVHWGIAPSYVSWCPLGFDNRPVFGFWRHGYRHRHDPWRGWTVVHKSHFGARRGVHVVAIDGLRVVTTQQAAFVTQAAPPAFRGDTRVRAADGRASHGIAVPRSGGGSIARVPPSDAQRSGRSASMQGVLTGTGPRSGAGVQGSSGSRYAIRRGDQDSASVGSGTGSSTDAFRRRRPGVDGGSDTAPASGIEADLGAFRRRSGRAVDRTPSAAPGWRAEDVPVYRGSPPAEGSFGVRHGRPGAVPRSAPSEPAISTDPVREVPDVTSPRGSRGNSGSYAVPRSGSEQAPTYAPPPRGESPARGSYGVRSSGGDSSSGGTAASGGDRGGRTRSAGAGSSSSGSSGGTAIRRGSGGSSESSGGGGGRATGRRR